MQKLVFKWIPVLDKSFPVQLLKNIYRIIIHKFVPSKAAVSSYYQNVGSGLCTSLWRSPPPSYNVTKTHTGLKSPPLQTVKSGHNMIWQFGQLFWLHIW